MAVENVELSSEDELRRISAVRTAATWMRKSGKPIEEYPKLQKLDPLQRQQTVQFASGILPWPARWTRRLFEAATRG